METAKVGIQEFRENLFSYLEAQTPISIIRDGATVGVFVPTMPLPKRRPVDLEAFRIAGEKMQELIAAAGTSEEELIADFEELRREERLKKKQKKQN